MGYQQVDSSEEVQLQQQWDCRRAVCFTCRVLCLVLVLFMVVLGLVWYYVVIPNYYNVTPLSDSNKTGGHHDIGWINKYTQLGKCLSTTYLLTVVKNTESSSL